jgi:hypothetical protein
MTKPAGVNEFAQALLASLRSIRRANEVPSYLSTKAREINAGYVEGVLSDVVKGPVVKEFLKCPAKIKICSDDTIRTKEDLLKEINEVKPLIDRIKSGGFKLMIDRYLAAHELAIRLSDVVDEVLAQNKAAVPAVKK